HFDVNVFGAVSVAKAFLPRFRKRRRGFIVNVTSISCWRRTILSETCLNASLPSRSCGGGLSDSMSSKTAAASLAGS
ncbi:SDR family NAD(P)-dependent oxidoreductase, partial [Rhizobium ruizarguesonis]